MANEGGDNLRNDDKNKQYDPTLDFYSEHFDPLKALNTPGVTPPIIDAKVYDNLSKYEQAYKNPSRQEVINAGSSKQQDVQTVPQRRWLPHQLPVPNERIKKKRNILTRMEEMTGPLQLLKKCKDEHIQIKVWTRHSHGIRGYCIAHVVLFDKHWNLALENVREVWTRPTRRKIPAGIGDPLETQNIKRKIVPPPITIVKSDKKVETCERQIDQLIVRGEQIAFITLLPCT
ncbi:hypothetical protein FQR65_LT09221 [Abscondita terminalis]|nr:hypothetical protein FQR65_LT09221 [Abscondita terminalis]